MLKKILFVLVSASLLLVSKSSAISLDDVQVWTGSGTNRAALVIHWSAPEVRNNSDVPNPAAEKSLVWGYRWDGTANAEEMFNTIFASDPRLFAVVSTPSMFGRSIYAMGYDLNNNSVFGAKNGTNVIPESYFTNGILTLADGDPDGFQSLDAGDLYWGGYFGPTWELWNENDLAGGFTNAPDRGTNPYWTADNPDEPFYGSHGEWDLAQAGLAGLELKNGSWIGYTVAAGGLDFFNPDEPGTIAYNLHKHAPQSPEAASPVSSFAAQIVSTQGPFGSSPYNETNSVLGAPSSRIYESASKPNSRVKLSEGIYNYSVVDGVTNKLILTLNADSSVIARFDQPVFDNPANPYGIDFKVFGNAFYPVTSGGFSSDTANMNALIIGTGVFAEPTKVSVSPGFTGQPGEDTNNPATWPWYRYDDGPYGDSDFPTHAYKWNRTGTNWTNELLDFTKPVNPMMQTRFSAGGLSAADGIDLYNGAGGGTGFDLSASGFESIQYIKVEGAAGFSGGEIDAFSIVRPMTIGDELSITPANLTNNTAQLFFQKPGQLNQNLAALNFTAVSDVAKISSSRLDDSVALASIPGASLNAVHLEIAPLLGTNAVTFQADVALSAGENYLGNGSDLLVWQRSGTNWNSKPFAFDAVKKQVQLSGVTNFSAFAVAQIIAPQLNVQALSNGFVFTFVPVANLAHSLERSTNLVDWTSLMTVNPTNTQAVTLGDNAPPSTNAFYRLRLTTP